MPSTFKDFTTDNPMLIEAKRYGRRFIGLGREKGQIAYLYLVGAIYLVLVILALAYHDAFSSFSIIAIQTGIACIVVPSVAQNAIAGEREKRTWDLLIVAPISRAQIVIGKYLSVVLVLAVMEACFLPLAVICFDPSAESRNGVIFAELISIAFGVLLAAFSTYVSSITTRSLACQSMTYMGTFLWMIALPALVGAISVADQTLPKAFLWAHPFVTMYYFSSQHGPDLFNGAQQSYNMPYSWWFQAAFYLGLTALFVLLAVGGANSKRIDAGGS